GTALFRLRTFLTLPISHDRQPRFPNPRGDGGGGCRTLRTVDHTLDDADLESRCPLDSLRPRHARPLEATRPVGKLDALPAELITAVLISLDLPVTATQATRATKIPRRKLQHVVPNILSLPGRYTPSGKLSRKRVLLFDRTALLELAGDVYEKSIENFISQHGPRRDRFDSDPRRYMSIISAPYLDPINRSVDWGSYCIRCRDSKMPNHYNFRNKLTRHELAEHVALCREEILEFWSRGLPADVELRGGELASHMDK
ncbi:hypothetical protein E4U41_003318, partial [Claviceps citrina]